MNETTLRNLYNTITDAHGTREQKFMQYLEVVKTIDKETHSKIQVAVLTDGKFRFEDNIKHWESDEDQPHENYFHQMKSDKQGFKDFGKYKDIRFLLEFKDDTENYLISEVKV